MRFRADSRAQAIQVGAVLIFGILIILLSLYQAFVVPDQNEEIEFNHNQEVQQEMTELRSDVISMPGSTHSRSSSVDLGVRYPSRTIFVNPGPASGSLRTIETTNESYNITIENAVVSDSEDIGVSDFWDTNDPSFNTGALEYRPGYNLYRNAPRTIYEHTAVFNTFVRQERSLPLTGQAMVENDRITLVALNGSLDENRIDRAAVDLKPVSTQSQPIDIEPEAGDTITIELPTSTTQDGWEEIYQNDDDVTVSASGDRLTLEVTGEYELRMAKIGVGTGVRSQEATYLAGVDGHDATISDTDTHEFTVQVRDRFNNPVRSVDVWAEAGQGTLEEDGEFPLSSNRAGEVTVEYEPPEVGSGEITDSVDFSLVGEIDGDYDANAPENVTLDITVESTGAGDSAAYNTMWQHPDEMDFDYDGNDLTLSMETDPVADGAKVEYAVGDRGIGFVDPTEGFTDSDGENSTSFRPCNNGEVNVYTSSGGDGDVIELEVINFGTLDLDPDTKNTESEHTWQFQRMCFEGDVDSITADYGGTGASFDGLDEGNITVEADGTPVDLEAGQSYSGESASFDIDGSFDPTDGVTVIIDGIENPDQDDFTAEMTFAGSQDSVTFEIPAQTTEAEASGTVDVQDDIFEDDTAFEVSFTFSNTEDDDAFLVVENEDASAETTQTVVEGDSPVTIEEDDIDRIEEDDTIRATLYETDRSNQLATDYTVVLAADADPPDITPVDPQDGDITSDNEQIIEATISDEDGVDEDSISVDVTDSGGEVFAEASVSDDGVSFDAGTDTLLVEVAEIDESYSNGDVDVEVTAADVNGDETFESWTFTVDATAPQITPVDPEDGDFTADEQQLIEATIEDDNTGVDEDSISVDVTDSDGDVFNGATISDDGVDFDGTTLTVDITEIGDEYADGDVVVDVTVEDDAGNEASEDWTFTVDTTPPDITPIDPEDGDLVGDNQVPIEVTIEDDLSGVDENTISVDVTDSDGDVFEDATVSDNGVSFDAGTDTLLVEVAEIGQQYADGDVFVSVDASDQVGNTNTEPWSFTISTDTPAFTKLDATTDGSGQNIDEVTYDWEAENVNEIFLEVLDENDNQLDSETVTQGVEDNTEILSWQTNEQDITIRAEARGPAGTEECEAVGISGSQTLNKEDFQCTTS